ncbi:MAG: 23S rRNA (pseudouridine(1915)-N(3))-methyltransferase RlmH [Bacteroidales bacterium]|nr:23S rRNA (pseudouridine(1915)-N(3))-methyltransferase RlmH [Bacteroidales bacterium]
MNIKIVVIGKIKEQYFQNALADYTKRISKYAKLEITELPDVEIPNKSNKKLDVKVIRQEGEQILKYIKEQDFVVSLEIAGTSLSSLDFAKFLENQVLAGKPNFVFVIGGSLGLSDAVKKRSNFALSFSKMTFPHQLFRVVLLEQIYRCFKINANEIYHK